MLALLGAWKALCLLEVHYKRTSEWFLKVQKKSVPPQRQGQGAALKESWLVACLSADTVAEMSKAIASRLIRATALPGYLLS